MLAKRNDGILHQHVLEKRFGPSYSVSRNGQIDTTTVSPCHFSLWCKIP